MPLIINLSSLHRLLPISSGVDAFAQLCDRYSHGYFSCCCPSMFTKLTNKAWVAWTYSQHLKTVINPYKLGELTTEQFLNRMLNIFSFLEDDNLIYPSVAIEELWKDKDSFISLRNVVNKTDLSNRLIALALLEKAWNAIIDFEEADLVKFEWITRENKPIFLISNTNELNVNKLLNLLRERFSNVRWKSVDLSSKMDDTPIEIAPNIYLYLSYRLRAYKTDRDNNEAQNSTPCLLRTLVSRLGCDTSQIQVVSQYGKDLEEATRLGIHTKNIHAARDYYPQAVKTLKQIV